MKLKCWSKTEKTNSAPSGATETIPIPRWDDAESRRPASGAGQEWSRYGFERNCASVRRRGLALSRKVEAALPPALTPGGLLGLVSSAPNQALIQRW